MKQLLVIAMIVLMGVGCKDNKTYQLTDYPVNYDGLLDTILPHFSKLHDSIPENQRFLPKNKGYMAVHKKERVYEWRHYTQAADGYSYFMVSRLEPSIKRDKYTSICGRFKRTATGAMDSASYEELFWTWKMKMPDLKEKSYILFKQIVEKGEVKQYLPEVSKGEWIMFPDKNVWYDKATQTWQSKPY
ncbi:MAG: hypothetical protein V4613_10300 [Bacteroidota bacterium]